MVSPPGIRAVFLDFDGLLSNSEDLHMDLLQSRLSERSCPAMPEDLIVSMFGVGNGKFELKKIRKWLEENALGDGKWTTPADIEQDLGEVWAGVMGSVELLDGAEGLRPEVAIVSTTTSAKLDIKCARHDVFALIPQDRKLCRDDPRLANYPRLKKPAPDLYLATLSIINQERSSHPANRSVLQPNECLVFEDSVIGVEAARRAGMRVVWVPHPLVRKVLRGLEARVLTGTLEEKERLDPMAAVRGRDKEWELEGMAELRESLAEFDYAKYGISIGSPAGLLPN